MQTRLALCSQYLRDVEAKLAQLNLSVESIEEQSTITEALSFLDQALRAVSLTRERIEALPETRSKIASG
jgi:hypothetical protein